MIRASAAGVLVAAALLPATASGATSLRVRDQLVFHHANGKPVTFPREVRVSCGPWSEDASAPSIHVQVGQRPRSGRPVVWELSAVLADVQRRPVVRLPNSFDFDQPVGAQLFAVTSDGNELNSDTEESSGSIRFGRVSCGPTVQISFRFRGHLGSEFSDGERVSVRGSFSATAR